MVCIARDYLRMIKVPYENKVLSHNPPHLHVTLKALVSIPPPSGIWLIETLHPKEVSYGLAACQAFPGSTVAGWPSHTAKWLLLSRLESLLGGRWELPACGLPTPSSCHSQLSCCCLGTDPCVQFEKHRPSNLSALLFADGLFLSLLVSLKAKRDSAHKEVSHPSGSLHTLTQSPFWGFWGQMKLDPIWKCGLHNLQWFSDNQNASLFLLCTHILPGWTWYSQKLPEISSLPKNLAEPVMIN